MAIESSGHSRGNPRLYELIEHAPKTGKSPTVWAFPQLIDYLKVAAQPVQGPWPPHQQPRPDPTEDSMPVAVPDPASASLAPASPAAPAPVAAEPPAVAEPPAQSAAAASTQDEAPIEVIRAAMTADSTDGTLTTATPPTGAAETPAPQPPAPET